MSLQEPVLRTVSVSVGWSLSPRFPDIRGALTELLINATGRDAAWSWDTIRGDPHIFVGDPEERLHTALYPTGLQIASEKPDLERLGAVSAATVEACSQLLGITELEEVGAGSTWTLAAGDLGQARHALEQWLFTPRLRTVFSPLGGRPDDLVLSLRFETDAGVVTTFRTEPITDEQAADGPFFLSDFEASEFPPAALIAGLIRTRQRSLGPAEALQLAVADLDQVLSHGEKLLATVGDTDDSAAG